MPIPFTTHNEGNPLVFAHANGYPPACYAPLYEQLAGHEVLAIHQRPLWEDSNPEELKDWRLLSDDLIRFLDEQKLDKATVVGHSVGGIATLRAAINHPERFERIVLLDPVLFMPIFIRGYRIIHALGLGPKLHPLAPAAQRRRRTFKNREVIFRSYRQKKVFRYLDDESLQAYIKGITCEDSEGFKLCYSPEWEIQIYVSGVWQDMELWRALPKLNVSLLIIRGEKTDTFFENTAQLVKKKLPSAKIVTIPETSHLLPLEKPEAVANEIKKFITS